MLIIQGFKCDVQSYSEAEKLYIEAEKSFNNIDIWINNAGINQAKKLFQYISTDNVNKVINVNLIGMMNGS